MPVSNEKQKRNSSSKITTNNMESMKSFQSKGSSEMKLSHEQIAKRAYEIWQAKGCPAGREVENWLEAESQLRAQTQKRKFN